MNRFFSEEKGGGEGVLLMSFNGSTNGELNKQIRTNKCESKSGNDYLFSSYSCVDSFNLFLHGFVHFHYVAIVVLIHTVHSAVIYCCNHSHSHILLTAISPLCHIHIAALTINRILN